MKKIFFVIIASKQDPWEAIFRQGQLETWLKDLSRSENYLASYSDNSLGPTLQDQADHRKIFFADGHPALCHISSPTFESEKIARFESHEGFGGLLSTSLSSIKFALDEFSPDLIIRTNVSSYWNLKVLRRVVEDLPASGIYGGVAGPIPRSISKTISFRKYASGAGIFMTPDIARLLINNANSLNLSLIDDLSIGSFMNKKRIRLTEMQRFDLNHPSETRQLSASDLTTHYHYRCKSGNLSREDVTIMKSLHNVIGK